MTEATPTPFTLDPAVEDEVRQVLTEHFAPLYHERVGPYVEGLLSMGGFVSRFEYFKSVVGPRMFQPETKLLVSGCGAGSEMVTAKQFGVGQVYGVEVEQFWVDVCKQRLRYVPDLHVAYYDGEFLPYGDGEFNAIASGHVIEHTRSPERYLRECMRVLAPGGYISLEFPNRYHHTELHTHLPSFEWLPRPVRNVIVRGLASGLSPLKKDARRRYSDIIVTDLKQISVGGIRRMLKRIGQPFSILDTARPIPGVTRCVIRKD